MRRLGGHVLHRHPALLVALAIAALAGTAGCGATPQPSPAAARAAQNDGPFQLVFEVPATTFRVSDAISGTATLAVMNGGPSELSGSGQGPLGFGVREVGGRARHMDFVQTGDCAPHPISPSAPITSGLKKSGGWDANDPDAAFYQAFFADPLFRLPAGTWDLTADASFYEGSGCTGPSHQMAATIRLTISD